MVLLYPGRFYLDIVDFHGPHEHCKNVQVPGLGGGTWTWARLKYVPWLGCCSRSLHEICQRTVGAKIIARDKIIARFSLCCWWCENMNRSNCFLNDIHVPTIN